MSSFSNNRGESQQSVNYEFMIQATVEKFFNEKKFVTIQKNFLNTTLQYQPAQEKHQGPIFVTISGNDGCTITLKYKCPKTAGQQKILKKVEEANLLGKINHQKFTFDSQNNILGNIIKVKVDQMHQGIFHFIQNLLSTAYSHLLKIIHSINHEQSNLQTSKSSTNDSAALKKIKSTFEKLRWLCISKIVAKKKKNFIYGIHNLQKCLLKEQLVSLEKESSTKFNEAEVEKIFDHYTREQEKKKKQKNNNENMILTGIKTKSFEPVDKNIPQSKFSKVQLIKSIYQIEKTSINKRVSEEIGKELSEEREGYLICKSPKKYGQRSFKVQTTILKHIRMEVCPSVSTFYIEQLEEPQTVPSCLYSKFYDGDIGDEGLNLKKKFRLIQSLASGLWFMEGVKIIHRDLKPKNILYTADPSLSCKIIDFGSAHPLQKYVQLKLQLNEPLSTTVKYNLFQEDTPLEIQALYTPALFQQHQNYDMYAFGVMLQEFFLNSNSKNLLGDYIWDNLMWIKDHLKLYDPGERLNPVQLGILLKLLLKCFIASKTSPV